MKKCQALVVSKVGLHARPAVLLVREATKFKSTVHIRDITNGRGAVNCKSIVSLLALGAANGHTVELEITGEDEQQAAEVLVKLIETDLDEPLHPES